MRRFASFACFDWSGQAIERPKGIALASIGAHPDVRPVLHRACRSWSRAEALEWLVRQADEQNDILIGVDISPTFPWCDRQAYFPGWEQSPHNPRALWALVDEFCRDDPFLGAGSFVSHKQAREYFRHGRGDIGACFGSSGIGRLRKVEHYQRATGQASSASCFNLVGAAQVGKASLTFMRLLNRLDGRIAFWPFDPIPETGPVLVEIYTSLAARAAGIGKSRSKIRSRTMLAAALENLGALPPDLPYSHCPDDHGCDALVTAAWLRKFARQQELWEPPEMDALTAAQEGWTFGIV